MMIKVVSRSRLRLGAFPFISREHQMCELNGPSKHETPKCTVFNFAPPDAVFAQTHYIVRYMVRHPFRYLPFQHSEIRGSAGLRLTPGVLCC